MHSGVITPKFIKSLFRLTTGLTKVVTFGIPGTTLRHIIGVNEGFGSFSTFLTKVLAFVLGCWSRIAFWVTFTIFLVLLRDRIIHGGHILSISLIMIPYFLQELLRMFILGLE